MSYGDLLGFIPDPPAETAPRQVAERASSAGMDPPTREAERKPRYVEKDPEDFVADAYAMMFASTGEAAKKGIDVELPCGDCVVEAARLMARG